MMLKKMFKQMNNSVYAKTMENVREHGDYELVNTPERFQKPVNKPLFKHRYIINEDLAMVEKDKQTVELNKPIFMGMSMLDCSKIHTYSFYYDVLKSKYDDKFKLVNTDTNSFEINVETYMKTSKKLMNIWIFSDFPAEHPDHDKSNSSKMK